jgi:hypothetical protein
MPPVIEQYDSQKYIPGIVSTNVLDTDHKIFVGGLPAYLTEVS